MTNVIIGGTATGATPLPVASTIDGVNDYVPIYTATATATQAINRNTYLGLSSAPLGLSDTQSPTNKTFNNTNSLTIKDGSFLLNNTADTTKVGVFSLAGNTTGTTRTYTMPNASVTLASLTGTETLTNKTLTNPTINSPTITNATITADTITGFTNANNGTLYGISITASQLTSSAAIGNGIILPQALLTGTGSSWAWQAWTPTLTNITKGNGTVTAKYTQIGKTVHFKFIFTLGSTSSMGSGPTFTLPVTSSSDFTGFAANIGWTASWDTDTSINNVGPLVWISTTTVEAYGISGSNNPLVQITATVPFTWAIGDILTSTGTYEAA